MSEQTQTAERPAPASTRPPIGATRPAGATDESDSFDGWAIVELTGHARCAGIVRVVEVKRGLTMIRVDIPDTGRGPSVKWYSPRAVYAIAPTSAAEAFDVAVEEARSGQEL